MNTGNRITGGQTMAPASETHPLVAIGKAASSGLRVSLTNGQKAPAASAAPADKQNRVVDAIEDIASALKGGVTEINRGSLVDIAPKPLQVTFTVVNSVGAGAQPITAYIFNEDYLTATPSDNGSGAGSVVKTYSDGFNGNLLNQIMQSYGIEGLPFKQIQMTVTDNTTGLQDKAALSQTNPRKITYNGDGTSTTQFIPISSTGNPAYQQPGFLIIDINTRVRRFEQIALSLGVGKTLSAILITH